MRHEQRLLREGGPLHTCFSCGVSDESIDLRSDVVAIETRAVEGRVRDAGRKEPREGRHATVPCGVRTLDHDAHGAHPHDHPVASLVERQRTVFDLSGRGGCTRNEESGADPLDHPVIRDVVCTDDDHPLAAAGPDPIAGKADGLRR